MRMNLMASAICVALIPSANAATIERRSVELQSNSAVAAVHRLIPMAVEAQGNAVEISKPAAAGRVRRRGCHSHGNYTIVPSNTTSTLSSALGSAYSTSSVNPSVTISATSSSGFSAVSTSTPMITASTTSASSSVSSIESSISTSSVASSTTSSIASSTLTSSASLTTSSIESSTSSSSTSSTTSSSAPSCTATSGSGVITNGGFESGALTPWAFNTYVGSFENEVITDGHVIEGCSAYKITPITDPASGSRQASISQTLTLSRLGAFTLTVYQGRLSSDPITESPSIAIIYGNQILRQGLACGSSSYPCTITGTDGTVWQQWQFSFVTNVIRGTLNVVTTWTDTAGENSPILYDGLVIS
ncbi:hypothetical protein F4821DRAFT_265096 [Hypoxylon rubiginosum]|uniref:Uncharacterized protein n=1 Tax=Hypoxylon rubiginosum TaxID=110542 RepID=A0ACC0CLI6_9PEZI|nr:hypothetical protein F4821DRAFT_265096 [Hypoxylon rubiginosum]